MKREWTEQRKSKNFYFPHDMNAHSDPKCVTLINVYGYHGYGMYWRLIEAMMHEANYFIPMEGKYATAGIEQMLQQDAIFVRGFIDDLVEMGLFVLLDNGTKLTSNALLARMKHVEKVRDARREAGLASALRRQKLRDEVVLPSDSSESKHSATNAQQNSNTTSTIKEKKSKVNKSKVKKIKETSNDIPATDSDESVAVEVVVAEKKKSKAEKVVEPIPFPLIDIYHEWFTERHGIPPKINGREVNAGKSIAKYLVKSAGDDVKKAEAAWRVILARWGTLDDFTQKRNRLVDIDSNLQNIIVAMKSKKVSKVDQANEELKEQIAKEFK